LVAGTFQGARELEKQINDPSGWHPVRRLANVYAINGLDHQLHSCYFIIRQVVEIFCAFLFGEPPIVLEAEADKEIYLPIRHLQNGEVTK